jgi:protein ImuB
VCTCIRIESQTEYGEHLSRIWRHHRAFTPAAVADRVRWQLDGWLAQRAVCGCPAGEPCPGGRACPNPAGGTSGGLSLVRLVPEEVAEDDGRQQGFWGGATAADERAARGLARLQGLLGPEAVVTAVLGGGRDPAERVRLVSWGDPREPARPGPPPGPLAPVAGRSLEGGGGGGGGPAPPPGPRDGGRRAAARHPPRSRPGRAGCHHRPPPWSTATRWPPKWWMGLATRWRSAAEAYSRPPRLGCRWPAAGGPTWPAGPGHGRPRNDGGTRPLTGAGLASRSLSPPAWPTSWAWKEAGGGWRQPMTDVPAVGDRP